MPSSGSRSFKTRFTMLVTLTSVLAVVLTCLLLVLVDYERLQAFAVSTLRTEAEMIAIHSEAALTFKDPAAGTETLAALRAEPEIIAASIYTTDGSPFATYLRSPGVVEILRPGPPGNRFEQGQLLYTSTIDRGPDRLGILVLAYDMGQVYSRLRFSALVTLGAGLVATLAAFFVALRLQRTLVQPVTSLMETAQAIASTKDYSIRAVKYNPDEVGQFTDAFNNMIDQIEQQREGLKLANQELRIRNQEMEQFVYTVSHDLKSPLVTAAGFVGLLTESAAEGNMPEVLDAAGHIQRAVTRMGQLIQDLLELSRIGRVRNELQEVDVRALVVEVADDLTPRLKEVGAKMIVEDSIPRVAADRVRLFQVFENLLSNAIKYGSGNPHPTITVGGLVVGHEVRLFVRDNGAGIAPAYHKKIFGLFQRLDNKTEGTGVGLAIVTRIAEVHGGRTWVESIPGQGATFWFALPKLNGAASG